MALSENASRTRYTIKIKLKLSIWVVFWKRGVTTVVVFGQLNVVSNILCFSYSSSIICYFVSPSDVQYSSCMMMNWQGGRLLFGEKASNHFLFISATDHILRFIAWWPDLYIRWLWHAKIQSAIKSWQKLRIVWHTTLCHRQSRPFLSPNVIWPLKSC